MVQKYGAKMCTFETSPIHPMCQCPYIKIPNKKTIKVITLGDATWTLENITERSFGDLCPLYYKKNQVTLAKGLEQVQRDYKCWRLISQGLVCNQKGPQKMPPSLAEEFWTIVWVLVKTP